MSAPGTLAGRKYSLVTGLCVRHDAISAAAVATYRCLDALSPGNVRLFAHAAEYPELRHTVVHSVTDLLFDPHFLDSDAVLYHFGVYYGLFDAMVLGNGKARQYVRFHNVTPKALVGPADWPTIDRSLAQLEHLRRAQHVWCDSDFNRRDLEARGFDPQRLSTLALPVDTGRAPRDARAEREGPVRIAFVGRLVRSKGVLELVKALAIASTRVRHPFRLFVAGNPTFADAAYGEEVRQALAEAGLAAQVHFCGGIDDGEKHALLRRSDLFVMPSHHEGFCVPVIEALAAGCHVLAYDAGNLPAIVGDLGRIVPTGNVEALAQALAESIDAVGAARGGGDPLLQCLAGALPRSELQRRGAAYAAGFGFDRFRESFCTSLTALEGAA